MKFPAALKQRSRIAYLRDRILGIHFLYSRHKPSTDWNIEDGLPDFTKLKLDQSFNWCLFSIPCWTIFNPQKEYQADYAVAAFSVKTIRSSHKSSGLSQTPILDVDHKPYSDNYSHVELFLFRELNKTERREIRMALRHNCRVPLRPNQAQSRLGLIIGLLKMYISRAIWSLTNQKELLSSSADDSN